MSDPNLPKLAAYNEFRKPIIGLTIYVEGAIADAMRAELLVRIAELDAERVRLTGEVGTAIRQTQEAIGQRDRAEATIERLKCCGSCRHYEVQDGLEWCQGALEPISAGDNPCHFTSPRWAERGEK